MKTFAAFALIIIAAVLSGCAGMTDVIAHRETLYAPKAFQAGSQEDAYRVAAAAGKAHYGTSVAGDKAVPAMIDAGIATANGKCREWLAKVSAAELRWDAGEGNLSVAQGLITGAAVAGYEQNFRATALGMSDYALQAKLREVMQLRADELKAQAGSMTYPEAIDRLEDYAALCSVQAAKAAARSSLNATITRATPAGTLTSTPK
jgi:hypothetical protein